MFVLLKGTAKEHLKTFISRGGVSFFGVQGMFVNVRFQILTYGEYKNDLSCGMLRCVVW
jgi:hypothetical protein